MMFRCISEVREYRVLQEPDAHEPGALARPQHQADLHPPSPSAGLSGGLTVMVLGRLHHLAVTTFEVPGCQESVLGCRVGYIAGPSLENCYNL